MLKCQHCVAPHYLWPLCRHSACRWQLSMLLCVGTNTWARLLAVSVQSTSPKASGEPGPASRPSVSDSRREMASPSLLLLSPPLSPARWWVEEPGPGLLLRLAPQLTSAETTLLSEADFFMARLVLLLVAEVVVVVVLVGDTTDGATNIVMGEGTGNKRKHFYGFVYTNIEITGRKVRCEDQI